ncbi:MAG: ImmA/IrrE family metallo-endopeptidase [Armatimonadetes bacterium]|nr:ImmA/IrrE family metallo-endopeptidase [Armatimonadota bacterium]
MLKNLDVPFSNNVLEQKAYELIRFHARKDDWTPALPIPVEAILERTLDLALVYEDLSPLGESVLGSLFPVERTVYLNENYLQSFDDCPGMQRFTIAHEIGHWQMHVNQAVLSQGLLFGDSDTRIICRDGDRDMKESAADRYAARLLMPKDLLQEAIPCYNVQTSSGFRRLAESIGVSFTALHYRLGDMAVQHAW